eukprot:Sspe_Gene.40454::Locus_19536_Transcript_1_1_Confidence_1.000_Length_888::g.40454::m.40454
MALRRTSAKHLFDPNFYHRFGTSKFTWSPEIRMFGKDEALPQEDYGTRVWEERKGYNGSNLSTWPMVDPVNPTKEQQRTLDTMTSSQFGNVLQPPYKMGFRTVPPELIDWRTTFYGDLFEELPYANEKMSYSCPDYTLAGLLYTGQEWKAFVDSTPKNVEDSAFAQSVSPKADTWMRIMNSMHLRNLRMTWSRAFCVLLTVFVAHLIHKGSMRAWEVQQRNSAMWWDGRYSGTYRYGGFRQKYVGWQAITGGNMFYFK